MGDYSYLPQQLEEHFEAHNKNDLDFIELNSLPSCLICFPIEDQSSRQFQDFWNWFLNKHSAETYTAYTTYYFDQAYFEDNFEERNNTTETPFETEKESYQIASVFDLLSSKLDSFTQTVTPELMANDPMQANILATLQELERRTQGLGEIVTEYAKAIRKLIKRIDFEKNWTEEQKIHSFTKELRTDLSYALWPLLALKNNPTINMAIELAQRIEDNQRMHLESTLLVFAPTPVMAPAPQIAAASFAAQTQDPNEQLIDRLTANLAQLLKSLAQAVRENQQPQRPRFESALISPNNHHINDSKIAAHLCAITVN
ncbi:hypothetical protein G9A89_019211 [Geosiphon pyriformis]|nr:hypothetical protein G9A89_019211 [Geosiphon pyriformis]